MSKSLLNSLSKNEDSESYRIERTKFGIEICNLQVEDDKTNVQRKITSDIVNTINHESSNISSTES